MACRDSGVSYLTGRGETRISMDEPELCGGNAPRDRSARWRLLPLHRPHCGASFGMKLTTFISAAIGMIWFGALVSRTAKADPKNRHRDQKVLEQSEKERSVYLTGSHLRQKVKVKSIGTDSAQNIRIYTRRELESTGRQNVGEALTTLDPSITLTGTH